IAPLNLPVIPRIEARALGGAIQANMPYLVGERGPEIIIPKQSGTVIPNEKISTSSNVNNVFHFNISIQGANPEYDAYTLYEKFIEIVNSQTNKAKQRYELGVT
ncbi:MAG: hypothetical protein N3A69_16755, partial [Leptospiraceae bacterium]|nr:hypothetical protein [Leptospiraceae bacterium]